MSKWLWIARMVVVAGWSQTQSAPVDVGPADVAPVASLGAFVIPSGTQLDVRLDEALSRTSPAIRSLSLLWML